MPVSLHRNDLFIGRFELSYINSLRPERCKRIFQLFVITGEIKDDLTSFGRDLGPAYIRHDIKSLDHAEQDRLIHEVLGEHHFQMLNCQNRSLLLRVHRSP